MTDWQQHYETGNTPWNRGGPSPALVQWLAGHRMHGRVLVPGCGHGHDLGPLAESGAEEVVGLDLAAGAVAAARERHAGRPDISLIHGDFFTFGPGEARGTFDHVFEHTCFCAIDPALRDAYVAAVTAALKPGGSLIAVFYLEPREKGEDQTQAPPFRTAKEELDIRFEPDFTLLESYVPDVSYPGREGRELFRVLRRN